MSLRAETSRPKRGVLLFRENSLDRRPLSGRKRSSKRIALNVRLKSEAAVPPPLSGRNFEVAFKFLPLNSSVVHKECANCEWRDLELLRKLLLCFIGIVAVEIIVYSFEWT